MKTVLEYQGERHELKPLRSAKPQRTLVGSTRSRSVARPRNEVQNPDDPRGQFGSFLRAFIDKNHGGDESRISKALDVSERTVRKWCEGAHGPAFQDLDRIAIALGFESWVDMALAVRRFHRHS